MEESLTLAEIMEKYKSEWVLIENPQTDERLEIESGRVVYHSKDRDEFDRQVLQFRASRFAVIFTGRPPADMEFALTPFISQ